MKKNPKQSSEPNLEQIAIERLRLSKQELETELRSNGMEAGREFVLKDRDADAACQRYLKRLDKEDRQFYCFADVAPVLSGDGGMEGDWRENFQAKYGDVIDEPEWVGGFIQGALEKFRDLEAKL